MASSAQFAQSGSRWLALRHTLSDVGVSRKSVARPPHASTSDGREAGFTFLERHQADAFPVGTNTGAANWRTRTTITTTIIAKRASMTTRTRLSHLVVHVQRAALKAVLFPKKGQRSKPAKAQLQVRPRRSRTLLRRRARSTLRSSTTRPMSSSVCFSPIISDID